jgi:hypothetical protein
MKVLRKAAMKDGTPVQIEDWSEDYSFYEYGEHIAAYPTVRGRRIRAELQTGSTEQAKEIFEKLLDGDTLEQHGFTVKRIGYNVPLYLYLHLDIT